MEARRLPARERRYIDESLAGGGADAEQLDQLGLATCSPSCRSQVGIVVTPALGDTVLKAMDFVPLSGRKVLCVVVSTTGFVDNKVIEIDEEMPREELMRISQLPDRELRRLDPARDPRAAAAHDGRGAQRRWTA